MWLFLVWVQLAQYLAVLVYDSFVCWISGETRDQCWCDSRIEGFIMMSLPCALFSWEVHFKWET